MEPVLNFSIKGFLETSFVDWPGKMAAMIFLAGCNYRCPYCHNHQLVTAAETLSDWPVEEVLGKLDALSGWLDGVCVSGGEPTLSPGLPDLLAALKARNFAVKLDTNGSRPEVLRRLVEDKLIDAVSLDVKAPLEAIPYRRNGGQGADPGKVVESLKILAASGLPVHLRTTVHPSLLSLAELQRMKASLDALFGRPVEIKLQAARVEDTLDPALRSTTPLDPDALAGMSAELHAPGVRKA